MKLPGDRLRAAVANLKADLTWRFIATVVFLGTVMTLAGVFLDRRAALA